MLQDSEKAVENLRKSKAAAEDQTQVAQKRCATLQVCYSEHAVCVYMCLQAFVFV